MSKIQRAVTTIVMLVLLAGHVSLLRSQAQSPAEEQQLRAQYRITRVGSNGTVVGEPGSLLVIEEDGLTAIPASYGAYWYNNVKKDGHIKTSFVQHGGTKAASQIRVLQVGEKLYVLGMDIKQAEIVFYVQSCGVCDPSVVDSNDVPYRARLAVQFDKGYLLASNSKQVQDTIGQIFGVEVVTNTKRPGVDPSGTPPLKLPATYVKPHSAGDQLQLKSDNSLLLQEAGQTYHGTFVTNGNTIDLDISETNVKSTVTIRDNNLIDSNGQSWILQQQPVVTASGGATLQNEDIVKMAKAGLDDATILSKIQKSQCQFDISTDALIQLKQDGVSASVINAMVVTGK